MTRRLTIKRLICEDLGYCCLWSFFRLHFSTQMIADRLGVSDRAVRYWKMAFRQGDLSCEKTEKCFQCRGRFQSSANQNQKPQLR